MRPDHTSPISPSENNIRPDAPRPDGIFTTLQTGIYPNQSNKHVCQTFLNGFYCIFSRRFQIYQIPFEILHI